MWVRIAEPHGYRLNVKWYYWIRSILKLYKIIVYKLLFLTANNKLNKYVTSEIAQPLYTLIIVLWSLLDIPYITQQFDSLSFSSKINRKGDSYEIQNTDKVVYSSQSWEDTHHPIFSLNSCTSYRFLYLDSPSCLVMFILYASTILPVINL